MITDLNSVDGHGGEEFFMHFLDDRSIDEAVSDVWLIGYDNERVACFLKATRAFSGAGVNAEIV
jgi:hypothetical protein